MTDKLTAAGTKVPLELQRYITASGAPLGVKPDQPLVVVHGYAMVRKDVADAAIDALVDLLVQATRELRLSNHMYAELTDKHTEALMRAETAEAENKRLKIERGLDD